MEKKIKKHSLLFIPASGKIKQLILSHMHMKYGLIFLILLLIANIGFFAYNIKSVPDIVESSRVKKTNDDLKVNLSMIEAKFDSAQTVLSSLADFEKQMRTMTGLPQISDSFGVIGFGGPQLRKNTYFGKSVLEKKSEDLIYGLDSLIAQSDIQLASYAEICSTYEKKRDIINRTPTIKPMKGYYSSPYGKRIDPFTQRYTMHEGIDIVAPKGTPVVATADGIVNFAGWYHGYGNSIVVNHKLYKTRYAHLSKINVKRGQKVKRGDVIGACGRTGKSTANHLHYEVHVNNKPVDPMDYIFPTGYTYD